MGKRGPKPKPTALKIAEGNRGKRKLNDREPKPHLLAEHQPPAYLDELAVAEWHRVFPELERLGLVSVLDVTPLAAYCQAVSDYAQARDWMRENGRVQVLRDDKGIVRSANPASQWYIAAKALEHIRRFGAEFGIGPASRSSLAVKPEVKQTLTDILDGTDASAIDISQLLQ